MKKLLTLALAFAMMFSLAACGGDSEKPADTEGEKQATTEDGTEGTEGTESTEAEGKIIRTNNSSEPGALDPGLASGTHDSWVLNHVFEGLMKKTKEGGVAPGTAESVEVSEDGLKYTFKIRSDAKWSNGDPVTAQDFEDPSACRAGNHRYLPWIKEEIAAPWLSRSQEWVCYLWPVGQNEDLCHILEDTPDLSVAW